MANVDNRIVEMTFDNREFEKNIATTLGSLETLKKSLDFGDAGKSLGDLSSAAEGFNFAGMGDAVDNISSKFSALGAIGFSVIQDLTQSALDFARGISGQLLDPLVSGGKSRATNIENAKFQFRGLGIDVNKAMDSALSAVRGTAFGLDEAAKAAAQFGASGVGAGKEMTTALRGIAGAAAMTNTSFTEIADIFTSVAGTGKLTNQDLNRFAVRGLNASATLAKQLGKTEAQIHEMARNGDIDFKTFSKAMDNAFGEHATKANETYTGALANMHAALARLGASFFGPRMEQQRNFFNALSPVIDNVNAALQPLIKSFLDIRGIGIGNLIDLLKGLDLSQFKAAIPNFAAALTNGFAAFSRVLDIVKASFRDVFPPNTTSVILTISQALLRFSQTLKFGTGTATEFRQIFNGIFDTFAIAFNVVKVVGELLGKLFQTMHKASGLGNSGILQFFADLGVKMTLLKIALVNGGELRAGIEAFISDVHDLFLKLRQDVNQAVDYIKKLLGVTSSIKVANFDGVTSSVSRLTDHLNPLSKAAELVGNAWSFLLNIFDGIQAAIDRAIGAIGETFKGMGHAIAGTFKTGNFDEVFNIINTGLIGGILFMIHKFMKTGFAEFGGDFLDKINIVFDKLTGTLEAMQLKVKAEALMKIAEAVGILVAALVVLALIDSNALSKALTAMAVGFGELAGVMKILDTVSGGAIKLTGLATGMIALSTAILVLSASVKVLSTMSWAELSKGLTGVAALLVAITAAVNFMPDSGAMVRAGIGITGIATGILILATAVQLMATMNWSDMAKGLTGVAVGIGVLTLAMNLMPNGAGMVAAGAGIVLVATGLNILAGAVKLFSLLNWGEMLKGLVGVGAALVVIAGAMQLMPLTLPITAFGLVLVGTALTSIALAMKIFATMSWGEMTRGLIAMAAALAVLAIATTAMTGTIAGSASIFIAASALAVIGKVIKEIGGMKWQDIARGLGGIAAALAVLAIAAELITPSIPSLLALGIALTLVGAGFALFGVGAAGVANALKLIADTGSTAIDALLSIIKVLLDKLPAFATKLAEGLIIVAQKLVKALPDILSHLDDILVALFVGIQGSIPELAKTIILIIDTILQTVNTEVPKFIDTGFRILINLLKGITDNLFEITATVITIILTFVDAVASKIPDIVRAGLNLLTQFLLGIATNIAKVIEAGFQVIVGIIDGISSGNLLIIAAGAKMITDLITGILSNIGTIIDSGTDAAVAFMQGLVKDQKKLLDGLGTFLVAIINNLADAIDKYAPQLQDAGKHLAGSILDGMTFGLAGKAGDVVKKAGDVSGSVIGGFKKAFKVLSPSKVMRDIGLNVMEGLSVGIGANGNAMKSARSSADGIVSVMNGSLSKVAMAMDNVDNFNPTISPVVDLTNVNRSADEIQAMMGKTSIGASISFDQASVIAANTNSQNGSDSEKPKAEIVRDIKFEQVIHSPKELSASDIYRNTKSQFAMAKGELAS